MASEAQRRATKKFENKAYFKTLVRFKKEDEARIRAAAGDSLNGYIVKCVLDALENAQNAQIEEKAKTMDETAQELQKPENKAEEKPQANSNLAELQSLIDAKKINNMQYVKEAEQNRLEKSI